MVLEPWTGPVPAHQDAVEIQICAGQGAASPGIKWKWVKYTTFSSVLK